MKSGVLLRAGALLALAFVAACDDPTSPGGNVPPDPDGPPGLVSSIRTLSRFSTTLTATGSFRPGQPVVITLSARALHGTQSAQLDIVLPEVARAELLGGYNAPPRPGAQIGPAVSRRTGLGRGAETQERYVAVFPEPGYYSVWGSVRSDDPAVGDSTLMQNEAHRVLYIYISESGGRVTERFEPDLLPPAAIRSLGPVRQREGVRPRPSGLPRPPRGTASASLASARVQPALSVGAQATMNIVASYYNASTGQYVPVADAEYELYTYDANFNLIQSDVGRFTPANGALLVSCDAYYAEIDVYANNSRTAVGNASNNFRIGQLLTGYSFYPQSDCSKGWTAHWTAMDAVPSHVFTNLNRIQQRSAAHFGRTRPQMAAIVVNDASYIPSAYCPNGNTGIPNCGHGGTGDYLRINAYVDTSPNGYGDQVWGKAGLFVQGHEYGHGFHEKALAGLMRYYKDCGGTHSMLTVMPNMGCALGEGFADYFAIAVLPGETGYDHAYETNHYYVNEVRKTSTDGSRSEAAISAFLFDVTDGNTVAGAETHDLVQYSGSVVATVMSTCEVYQGGAWILNNGIDHLVYCFERNVDPAVTGSTTFFTTRSPDPTQQRVSSAVTSPTEIRKLWRKNLYAM